MTRDQDAAAAVTDVGWAGPSWRCRENTEHWGVESACRTTLDVAKSLRLDHRPAITFQGGVGKMASFGI